MDQNDICGYKWHYSWRVIYNIERVILQNCLSVPLLFPRIYVILFWHSNHFLLHPYICCLSFSIANAFKPATFSFFNSFPCNSSSSLKQNFSLLCKILHHLQSVAISCCNRKGIRTRGRRIDTSVKLDGVFWWRLVLLVESWFVNIFMLCWLLVLLKLLVTGIWKMNS